MSKITIDLESAVATVIANTPRDGERQTARQRSAADHAFARVLKLIAPRIRHFIRQYGLGAHWDDAEQCCAIGVHRAIQAYDPDKAQFTTFVNWQIRGELQSLRFRLMTDQRPSARKVDATTVSLHATTLGADGEETTLEAVIEDESAVARTEAAASAHLTGTTRSALMDRYMAHLRSVGLENLRRRARATRNPNAPLPPGTVRLRAMIEAVDPADVAALDHDLAEHCRLVETRLFDDVVAAAEDPLSAERARQVARRAAKVMATLAAKDERFGTILEDRALRDVLPRRPRVQPRRDPAVAMPSPETTR
jgi:hypothetical protein